MGDEAFYFKILKVYLKDEMVDTLQQDYEAGDWAQYQIHVHGLKICLRISEPWSCLGSLRD